MASQVSEIPQQSIAINPNYKLKSVKEVAETLNLNSIIPPNYAYFSDPISSPLDSDDLHASIPVIDFSLLQSGTPHQRSKIIQDLGNACEDWGFFMVVNHGVPERLMKGMIDKCEEFFNLTVEEKREFEGKHVLDPIRYGTSFNPSAEEVHFWRDYLKVMVHPQFHSPTKPHGFSELSSKYCKQVRDVVQVLLRGISISLGLDDEFEIERSMGLEMGQQVLVANLYPPCPQPELAIGMPPHSDHGLLTLLTHNQVSGLQIQHNGRWVPVNALPNSFLVNTGDHMEILSNGKYKSVVHRATLNNKDTRISLAIANGPSLDKVVSPLPRLMINGVEAKYKAMLYRDYLELQQSNRLNANSSLDIVRV